MAHESSEAEIHISETEIRRSLFLQRCDLSFPFSGRMQDIRKYLHDDPCVDH